MKLRLKNKLIIGKTCKDTSWKEG